MPLLRTFAQEGHACRERFLFEINIFDQLAGK